MRTKPTRCPKCHAVLDAATLAYNSRLDQNKIADSKSMVPDTVPEPGSITMCLTCTRFLVFDDNMKLRVLSHTEVGNLPADLRDTLYRMQRAVQETSLTWLPRRP